jgi:hypothetical protein
MLRTARQRGRPPKNALPPPPVATAVPPQQISEEEKIATAGVVWGPALDDATFQQVVLHMTSSGRPANTSKQYDGKTREYREYCDSLYPNELYRQILCCSKVYRFVFYHAMRGKKKRGLIKKEEDATDGTTTVSVGSGPFNRADFDATTAKYSGWLQNPTGPPLEPMDPVGERMIAAYKTVIKWIYKDQVARGVLSLTWDAIWGLPLLNLHNLVKHRRCAQDKRNYVEKLDADFAPYQIAEEFPKIEQAVWSRGEHCFRSAYAWLRHRFCILFTTSGILRCESLYKAELSDFLGLRMKKPSDVHPLYVMVMQIATGKTHYFSNYFPIVLFFSNPVSDFAPLFCLLLIVVSYLVIIREGKTNHGQKLYGRAMRHKVVERCCVGGLAFYLAMRFHLTREFEEFTVSDWIDNSKWFDVKLLVDATRSDSNLSESMTDQVYAKAVKSVLGELGIASSHWVHLGRVTGPKILEMLEHEADEIRTLGNWNPTMQEKCYSTKMPMRPIRAIGGFTEAGGMHYSMRTIVEATKKLMESTPYGYFFAAFISLEGFGGSKYTAMAFLRMMMELSKIFLQDAAAMLISCPERISHPLFTLPCFQHPDWAVSGLLLFRFEFFCCFSTANQIFFFFLQPYLEKMREALAGAIDPMDHNIEAVLPGVHSRMSAMQNEMTGMRSSVNQLGENVTFALEKVTVSLNDVSNQLVRRDEELAVGLVDMARRLRPASPSPSPSIFHPSTRSVAQERREVENNSTFSPTESGTFPLPVTMPIGHHLRVKYGSIHTIYYEWFGLENFDGIPVEGGIDTCESEWRSKWRNHFSGAEKQHFSRVKAIINAIIEQTNVDEDGGIHQVLDELEVVFISEEIKKSVSNMSKWLKMKGYVTTQSPRGKRKSILTTADI